MRVRNWLVGVSVVAYAIALIAPVGESWFVYVQLLGVALKATFMLMSPEVYSLHFLATYPFSLASAFAFFWCTIRLKNLKTSYWSPRSLFLYWLALQNLGGLILLVSRVETLGPLAQTLFNVLIPMTIAYVSLAIATVITVRSNRHSGCATGTRTVDQP